MCDIENNSKWNSEPDDRIKNEFSNVCMNMYNITISRSW